MGISTRIVTLQNTNNHDHLCGDNLSRHNYNPETCHLVHRSKPFRVRNFCLYCIGSNFYVVCHHPTSSEDEICYSEFLFEVGVILQIFLNFGIKFVFNFFLFFEEISRSWRFKCLKKMPFIPFNSLDVNIRNWRTLLLISGLIRNPNWIVETVFLKKVILYHWLADDPLF